ncbi:MAG: hypothetical protein WAV38_05480 [Xanthobacteraceae bacterium]
MDEIAIGSLVLLCGVAVALQQLTHCSRSGNLAMFAAIRRAYPQKKIPRYRTNRGQSLALW